MATYWENSCSFGLRYVSWYKCLIVSLVFSHLGFWCGNLFLFAPFPDLCLLVPFEIPNIFIIFLTVTNLNLCYRYHTSKISLKQQLYNKIGMFIEAFTLRLIYFSVVIFAV